MIHHVAEPISPSSPPSGDLLSPGIALRLGRLAIVARKLVGTRTRGRRRTRRIGAGIETIDLRAYAVGDDPRRIAWHAYARLERLLVRLVADEAPLRLTLVLDQSASMSFAGLEADTESLTKLRQAKRILAGFAAVALGGEDRVALAAGSSTSAIGHRAVTGRNGLGRILTMLEPLDARGKTDLPRAVRAALDAAPGRGVCVIASDLFEPDIALAGAREAHRRGQDVVLVEVLTPFEIAPPDLTGYDLEDEETGELVELDERGTHERYAAALADHQRSIDEAARSIGAIVVRTSTAEPFEAIVTRALGAGVLGGAR